VSTFPGWAPDPRISVAGPDQETHHSVVLKLDQVGQSGSAAGWHSVVPVSGVGAGWGLAYIVYSLVPVWCYIVMGIIVYMDNKNNKDNRDRLDWTWVLPILWAMLIFSLIIIGS